MIRKLFYRSALTRHLPDHAGAQDSSPATGPRRIEQIRPRIILETLKLIEDALVGSVSDSAEAARRRVRRSKPTRTQLLQPCQRSFSSARPMPRSPWWILRLPLGFCKRSVDMIQGLAKGV